MKMTAAVLHEQGVPHAFAVSMPLRIDMVTLAPPDPGEVLIQVAAAGLCRFRVPTIEGVGRRTRPAVVGHEGAGVVVEVGLGVHDVTVGLTTPA